MNTLPLLNDRPENADAFFALVLDCIQRRLNDAGLKVESLKPLTVASQVNFLFEGTMDGVSVVVKASFFDRSILFTYEKFMMGDDKDFSHELDEYSLSTTKSLLGEERRSLEILSAAGIRVPTVMEFVSPNILVSEKIDGQTVETNLAGAIGTSGDLAGNLKAIHAISDSNGVESAVSFHDGKMNFNDPNFGRTLVLESEFANELEGFVLTIEGRGKKMLHGDLKTNNLMVDKDGRLVFLDPKMHRGYVSYDLGKLIVRGAIAGVRDGVKKVIEKFLVSTLENYATDGDADRLEAEGMLLGLMEVSHIAEMPLRKNAVLLGRELEMLHSQRKQVRIAINTLLKQSKLPIGQLFSILD